MHYQRCSYCAAERIYAGPENTRGCITIKFGPVQKILYYHVMHAVYCDPAFANVYEAYIYAMKSLVHW